MHLAYTPEQERLRQQLRDYFAGLMTPELRRGLAETGGDYGDGQAYRAIVRQLGRDGWLALGWPAAYGGRDGSMLDQLIFTDEAASAGVPVPFLTLNTVGPTIMRFGTAEQKARYLPRIAAGEIHFSIGYSEPEAGTDLAALRTRAVRVQGDGAGTGGCPSSSCRPTPPGSPGRRCTRWPGRPPARPTTPTCACPPPRWSARRT